jgi:hypothetical protein
MSLSQETRLRAKVAGLLRVDWATVYDLEDELRAAAAGVFGVHEMEVQISGQPYGLMVAFPVWDDVRKRVKSTRVVFVA